MAAEDKSFYREFYSESATAEDQGHNSPKKPDEEGSNVPMIDAEQALAPKLTQRKTSAGDADIPPLAPPETSVSS